MVRFTALSRHWTGKLSKASKLGQAKLFVEKPDPGDIVVDVCG